MKNTLESMHETDRRACEDAGRPGLPISVVRRMAPTYPHASEAATLLRMSTTLGVTEPQRVALVKAAQRELDREALGVWAGRNVF